MFSYVLDQLIILFQFDLMLFKQLIVVSNNIFVGYYNILTKISIFRCQKLTDYFPVRRSKRQPLSKIKDLEYEQLKEKILNKCTDGLEVLKMFPIGVHQSSHELGLE